MVGLGRAARIRRGAWDACEDVRRVEIILSLLFCCIRTFCGVLTKMATFLNPSQSSSGVPGSTYCFTCLSRRTRSSKKRSRGGQWTVGWRTSRASPGGRFVFPDLFPFQLEAGALLLLVRWWLGWNGNLHTDSEPVEPRRGMSITKMVTFLVVPLFPNSSLSLSLPSLHCFHSGTPIRP